MKVLLLGANGQLGRTYLRHDALTHLGSITAVSRDGVLVEGGRGEAADMAEPEEFLALLERTSPDIIVNAAAYTAVDRAEKDSAMAFRINAEAVALLAKWAERHGALVVHFSTDYVFDGRATSPYPICAPTGPVSVYGQSKLAGEEALRASTAPHMVFRTSWVYASRGHNFLLTMLRLGKERDHVRVVADQYGAPTSTNLLVEATAAALRQWVNAPGSVRPSLEGTYHLVASGATTWHGFATASLEQARSLGVLTKMPQIEAITTADYPTPARRPTYSVLDNMMFQERFGIVLPHWTAGLAEVMRELAPQGN